MNTPDIQDETGPEELIGSRNGDARLWALEGTIKRYQHRPDALIEVLSAAQRIYGMLDEDTLRYVARSLRLPTSHVYGVASFYHLFTLHPKGKHVCGVCMGTPCRVKGSRDLLNAIERTTEIHAGETTPDGELSLQAIKCPGACGIAPVVYFDGEPSGYETVESVVSHLKGWMKHGLNRAA